MRRIFIGDIHGEAEALVELLQELKLHETDEIVFLGDYIDKGRDSKGTIEVLSLVSSQLPQTRFLWGNHEDMLYNWLTGNDNTYIQTYEGIQTIRQLAENSSIVNRNNILYARDGTGEMVIQDVEIKELIYNTYESFFNVLEVVADYPEHVAVHGGLNFRLTDPIYDTPRHQALNSRWFVSGSPLDKLIIVGHTPQDKITLSDDKKMVNIDTGSGVGGYISALIYNKNYDIYTDINGKDVGFFDEGLY